MFSCEYCEIFKNSFFYKTPPLVASEGVHHIVSAPMKTATFQKIFTCSKSTIETIEKAEKFVQSKQQRHENDLNDIVMLYLLFMNTSHTFSSGFILFTPSINCLLDYRIF